VPETAASDASSNTSRSDRPEISGAVAVMDVEIDHRGAADAVFALGVTGGDGDIVEKAKPIGLLTSA